MSILFDRLTATLERSMDFALERANVISANLANLDTPGYTPTELNFDEQLSQYLTGEMPAGISATQERHLSTVVNEPRADVEFDNYALPNQDGNSVDLDHEMFKLSTNQARYHGSTVFYNKRMALMKYAITEGGSS